MTDSEPSNPEVKGVSFFGWQQLTVLAVGAAIFISLLFAEKTRPLDNKANTAPAAQLKDSHSDGGHTDGAQSSPESPELSAKMQKLSAGLAEAKTIADSLKALDQMVAGYMDAGRPDLAAKNQAIYARLKPEPEMLLKTGNLWKEASFLQEQTGGNPETIGASMKEAANWYQKYLAVKPNDIDAQVDLALVSISPQAPMAGIKVLKDLADKHPENYKANLEVGKLAVQSRQLDKAVLRFKAAIKANERGVEAHFFLARTYQELGQKDDAKKSFETALSLSDDPDMSALIKQQMAQ